MTSILDIILKDIKLIITSFIQRHIQLMGGDTTGKGLGLS